MKVQILIILALQVLGVFSAGCTVKRPFATPVYKQCDPRWGGNRLGTSSTICNYGCLMSSMSAAMASLGKTVSGQTATPGTLNTWLLANGGYSGNYFTWGAVTSYGITYGSQSNVHSTIQNAICANKIVILNVCYGGHWVLATGWTDSTYQVMDPGYTKTTYNANEVVGSLIYNA